MAFGICHAFIERSYLLFFFRTFEDSARLCYQHWKDIIDKKMFRKVLIVLIVKGLPSFFMASLTRSCTYFAFTLLRYHNICCFQKFIIIGLFISRASEKWGLIFEESNEKKIKIILLKMNFILDWNCSVMRIIFAYICAKTNVDFTNRLLIGNIEKCRLRNGFSNW